MRVPITRAQLIALLKEAESTHRLVTEAVALGLDKGRFSTGCAFGNVLHFLAPRARAGAVTNAACEVWHRGSQSWDRDLRDPSLIGDFLEEGRYESALSCAFEGYYPRGGIKRVCEVIEKRFPKLMMMDTDGLRVNLADIKRRLRALMARRRRAAT